MLRRGLAISLIFLISFMIWPSFVARAQPPAPSSPNQPSQSPSKGSKAAARKPATQPKLTKLPDVSITATRITTPLGKIGVTTTVVTNQQIQDQKIQQTSDALREVPGVIVTQNGGPGTLTDVSIRGSSSAEVLTLLDGVEVNTGGAGSFDYANLTTDNASRIEVVRGAGGSLYGSSAIGGVVNQISQEGTGPIKLSLLSDGGSWASERQVGTVNGAKGDLGYSGAVSYFSTNGFQPYGGADNLSLTSRLDWHLTDDTTIRGFGRYTSANVGLPEFSNFAVNPPSLLDPTAHQRTEFMLFKGEIDSHITEKLLVRAFGSFVRDEIRINKVPSPGLLNSETDDVPDEIRGANGEATYTWLPGFASLMGFDFKDRWGRDGDNSTFPPSPASVTVFHASRQEYAWYVQQQGSFFHGHLLVTGGFREDWNSQFGNELSPSWSVALPFDEYGITLRGSYSEGFLAPSFDQLYFPDFGNPNLKASTSSEYDGGIEKRFGELAGITVTYFSRRVHQLIVDVPCTPTPTSCQFGSLPENLGRADMQGVEVVPSLYLFKGFSLNGSFTALDSTHSPRITDLQPVRVPKHSASAVAQYKHSNLFMSGDQFISSLFYQFVGDREDLDTQAPFTEHNHSNYQLFNLTLSYKLGGIVPHLYDEEVFARIQNLFDRDYSQSFGFPAPPINFEAGIKVEIMP